MTQILCEIKTGNDQPYYFIIVQCPPGTYQQQNNCIMCPFGTYQPQDGQYTCKQCGPQKSTKFPASKSNQDCVGKLRNKQFLVEIKSRMYSPAQYLQVL